MQPRERDGIASTGASAAVLTNKVIHRFRGYLAAAHESRGIPPFSPRRARMTEDASKSKTRAKADNRRVRAEGEPFVPIPGGALAEGAGVIEAQLARLPAGPGVYRMLNAKGDALYVGKAKSLKKRVAAYTQVDRLSNRLRRMVAETASLEVISTQSEV